MRFGFNALIASFILIFSFQANATEIFFNGVRVTGLKEQTFEGCTVRFDKKGNVHITAKGYSVKNAEESADKGKKTENNLTKKYFLVTAGKNAENAQFDVDVFINGKWIRKVRSSEGQVVAEVTKYLKKGKNSVSFSAIKNLNGKPRLATDASTYLRVLIGMGTKGGATVNIEQTLADFRATADKTENYGKSATVNAE